MSEVSVYIKSNNSKIESAFTEQKIHTDLSFTKIENRQPYKLLVVDLGSELTNISHEIVNIYETCRNDNSKLAIAVLFKEFIDTENKHYFHNLLEKLGKDKPLHRLIFVKDLYTISSDSVTNLDNYLKKTQKENSIIISKKGKNIFYPLALSDFVNALIKTLFLSNTNGATFWVLGDPITDLELSYQLKRLSPTKSSPELEINAISEDNPELKTLQTLGNKTRAEINWQPENDFFFDLKEKISLNSDTPTPEVEHHGRLDQVQRFLAWMYRTRGSKKTKPPIIKKVAFCLLKFFATILVLSSLITIASTSLSLYHLDKSVTDILQGDKEKSLKNLNRTKYLKEIGESLYSNYLPLGNTLLPRETEKWFNVYSFIEYSISSLENVHQTYSFGESLLLSLNSQDNKSNYTDLSLGLNSNLSQIYENINQILILSNNGKLPDVITKRLQQSDTFKKLPKLESEVAQYIKTTTIIPALLSGENDKKILVLLQNSHQLKPLGGVVEDYLLITLNQGVLVSKQHYLSTDLDLLYQKNSTTATNLAKTNTKSFSKVDDVFEEPDFQIASQNLSNYFEKSTKIKIDSVIAINNNLFETLLSEEKSPHLETFSTKMKEASPSSTYRELSDSYLDKLFGHQIPLPVIGRAISKTLEETQVFFWTADEETRKQISSQSYTGSISQHQCSSSLGNGNSCLSETTYLSESISENQINIWDSRNLNHSIKLSLDKTEHQYQLNYTFPKDAEGESYNTTLHLYLPAASNLDQVLLNKLPASLKQTQKTNHNGLDHYQIPLTFQIAENTELQIKATVNKPKSTPPLSYSITEYRQPGLTEKGINLTIWYPDSLRPSIVTSQFTQEPQQLKLTLPPKTSSFGLVLVPQTQ